MKKPTATPTTGAPTTRHTTIPLRGLLAVSAMTFTLLGFATAGAGAADSVGCWPLAADVGNLAGTSHALPDDMVQALMTPGDCGVA